MVRYPSPLHAKERALATDTLMSGLLPVKDICDLISDFSAGLDGTCKYSLCSHLSCVNALITLHDGRLASACNDTVMAWTDGECSHMMFGSHYGEVTCLAALPPDKLASASGANVYIWGSTFSPQTLACHGEVIDLAVLEDGTLAAGSSDMTVRIWNVPEASLVHTLAGHHGAVISLAALPQNKLASSSMDKTVKTWLNGECVTTLVGHRLGVTKLATLLNGNLVSSSDDHTLRVWDVESGECLTVARHTHFVRTLDVMHDGTLITGSHDGTVCAWDGTNSGVIFSQPFPISALAVLPTGELAVASNKTVRVFE
jgi:WD40 repeat protein